MARAHYRNVVLARDGSALQGVSVEVRQPGTSTPIVDPLFPDATTLTPIANPLTTDANGVADFYLDTLQIVDLYVSGGTIDSPVTIASLDAGTTIVVDTTSTTGLTGAYATAAEYRTSLTPQKSDTGDDTAILRDLTVITRFVEQKCGRFFGKDSVDVARDFIAPATGPVYPEAENPWKFAGRYNKTLYLPDSDLVSVTSVYTDENGDGTPEMLRDPSQYQLWPLNADKGPEPRPYAALVIPEWATTGLLGWPPGRLVRVTGIWGWPAIPLPVKAGVIQLTAILRLETPRASQTVNDLGQVIGMSPQARSIVRELVGVYQRASW